ncbi:MAG: hypothetical protein LBD80_01695 [Tannerella sp.]|jgi:hypothetical protein|nr:hypothetical protein [Tannerella sp.]
MKSYSNVRPSVFQDLGGGRWYYNFNIKIKVKESPPVAGNASVINAARGQTAFEYETVLIWGNPDYATIVQAVINDRYNKDDEFSLVNKGVEDNANADYVAYRSWVNGVKTMVKDDLQEFNSLKK